LTAKLDDVSEPLSRAADVLVREHQARAAAQARLSGNENAKAVWIRILASEVRAQRADASRQASFVAVKSAPRQARGVAVKSAFRQARGVAVKSCGGQMRPVPIASGCFRFPSPAAWFCAWA
jgi:hypothetical protein